MKILFASVPGAGKTTVLKLVKRKIPCAKIVSAGDLFFEIAKKKFKIKNREEIGQKLSICQQRELQDPTLAKLGQLFTSRSLSNCLCLGLRGPGWQESRVRWPGFEFPS